MALAASSGCGRADPGPPDDRPHVLWVVWDTVRADHLSLYGYERPTTPLLDEWSRDARVFDDCIATASSTVPSHASMFTGLLPSEHDTNSRHRWLDDHQETIAELFQAAGYQTYLFSANPHIASSENFQQGFDVEEHPWDPKYRDEALRIVRTKVRPEDHSSELANKLRLLTLGEWDIKACGELAQRGLESWLERRDPDRPCFMFLNYMEAHRPFIPPRSYRERLMTPEQVERSYQVDRSWLPMWSYTFGLHDYSPEELAVMAGTYDACLAELDALFSDLLQGLAGHIDLDRTIIVLVSDHGEHLGEHHMLDHQYSLYNPLIHVPLVVRYPPRFAPGRDERPVVIYDLFPTLLELAGIEPPPGLAGGAVSLLSAPAARDRLAEYPAPFVVPFRSVLARHPQWDPAPWIRVLRAFHHGDYKYIWASDGRNELYHNRADRAEQDNLIDELDEVHRDLAARLDGFVSGLTPPAHPPDEVPALPEETRRQLGGLGYVDTGADGDERSQDEPAWPTLPMPKKPE
jgi:arylsulfatase A-like enzyme